MAPLLTVSLILSACASEPKSSSVDLRWAFCEIRPQHPLACLELEDVGKVRKALIECESHGQP